MKLEVVHIDRMKMLEIHPVALHVTRHFDLLLIVDQCLSRSIAYFPPVIHKVPFHGFVSPTIRLRSPDKLSELQILANESSLATPPRFSTQIANRDQGRGQDRTSHL